MFFKRPKMNHANFKVKPIEFLNDHKPASLVADGDFTANHQESKTKKCKNRLREMFLITTIHGIQNIMNTSNLFIKILWLLCFSFSTVACSYFVSKSILNYLEFDIVTVITNIFEQELQFPTLSFCTTAAPGFKYFPVIACTFNSNNCITEFQVYSDLFYGTCYRFNSGKDIYNRSTDLLKASVGGSRYGLKLDINLTQPDGKEDFNELALLIHNYTSTPMNLRTKGYRLLTGSINYFEVERYIDEKLDQPYNDCYKNLDDFTTNSTLINFFRNNNNSYDETDCIRVCRNLYVSEESGCNCIKTYDSSGDCSSNVNLTIRSCYEAYISDFQKKNVFKLCSKYCPNLCQTSGYSIQTYAFSLPGSGKITGKAFEYGELFSTYENVQKHFLSVRVFYPELKYTNIRQHPKTETFDLISNIGGTFGLFLGISFLSFIEIVDVVIEIIFIFFSKQI